MQCPRITSCIKLLDFGLFYATIDDDDDDVDAVVVVFAAASF